MCLNVQYTVESVQNIYNYFGKVVFNDYILVTIVDQITSSCHLQFTRITSKSKPRQWHSQGAGTRRPPRLKKRTKRNRKRKKKERKKWRKKEKESYREKPSELGGSFMLCQNRWFSHLIKKPFKYRQLYRLPQLIWFFSVIGC